MVDEKDVVVAEEVVEAMVDEVITMKDNGQMANFITMVSRDILPEIAGPPAVVPSTIQRKKKWKIFFWA